MTEIMSVKYVRRYGALFIVDFFLLLFPLSLVPCLVIALSSLPIIVLVLLLSLLLILGPHRHSFLPLFHRSVNIFRERSS